MMNKYSFPLLKNVSCLVLLLALSMVSKAQDQVEMADTMRSNGKIYIVVAVCLSILVGLFAYVATVDRRLRKWEKEEKMSG